MKRPGWLGGGPGEENDEGATETEAPDRPADGEKVSVPFGKDRTSTEPRRQLARRVRAASEDEPAEDASQRSARRRRARTATGPTHDDGADRKRRAPAARARAAEARGVVGSTLKEGTEETTKRTREAAPDVAAGLLKLLGALFAVFFNVVAFVLTLLIGAGSLAAGPGRALLGRVRRGLDAVSRLLTPARALALVVAGAAVLLALSQFADYRSITISTDAYSAVETVAPPPEVERDVTGDPHSYAFVPVAVIALLLLAAALRGRWKLCRLIAIGGIAAILVALVIDRPAGLDPGDAAQRFDGAEGQLLGGFYAQLFSGLLLTVSSLLLARELRLQEATRPARAAGSARSGRRMRLPRAGRGAEGARA